MPKRLTLLCVPALVFLSATAFAQNPNDFLRMFGGIIQQGMIQAASSEWRKLPPSEVSCIDQRLRQQGASVDALASRGIFPSDPRLAQFHSDCRGEIVQTPAPTRVQASLYVVDGLALGSRVHFESETYRRYHCDPSEKFPGFTWCHKEETTKEKEKAILRSNSILHTADGTAWYVNAYIEPAFFAPNDVQKEIDRLSARFGERPREFRLPPREGLPNAIIAVWGKIELEELDAADVATVASDGTVRGVLISYLGDLQRSARAGVPVYRLAGGPGFAWAATFNSDGRGVLRFLTIDASQIAPSSFATNKTIPTDIVQLPNASPTEPSPPVRSANGGQPKQPAAEFARLLALPKSCSALREASQAGPPRFPHPPVVLCPQERDCLYTLSPQIGALISFIRARPLLTAELRKQPFLTSGRFASFDSLLSDLQKAANASTLVNLNQSPQFVCAEISERLDRDVFRFSLQPTLRAEGFEAFSTLAQSFLSKLQSDYEADLARYSDWLPFAKHYDQQADLVRLRDQYETAYASDPEQFLRLRSDFTQALSAAEQFKARLLSQTDDLATLEAKVSDLLRRFGETPIAQLVTAEETAALADLRNDIARLRNTPPEDRGDASKEIRQLTDRISAFDTEISLEVKRAAIVGEFAKLQAYLNQPDVHVRLSKDAESDLANLSAQIAVLSQIGTVRLSDRDDYSDKMAAAEAALARIEKDKQQITQVLQLGQDLKTLNDKIDRRGRDLLDADTSSRLAELEKSLAAVNASGVPIPDEKLSDLRTSIDKLLGEIDAIMQRGAAQKEARQKGDEYARSGESSWRLQTKKDPMTDRTVATAISVQKNDFGVTAEVKGYCGTTEALGGDVIFTALIGDDQGNPTIEIPRTQSFPGVFGTTASIRINDNQPQTEILQPLSNFRNELLIASLAKEPLSPTGVQQMPLSDIWRIYVRFDTSRQPILIKIPMYDKAVQEMIASCVSEESIQYQSDPKLDSLRLVVRPGIADFDFNVGQLWTCLSQAPKGAKVIRRSYDNSGETVRLQLGNGWSDFHFRIMGDSALLDFARGSDGSVAQTWNELYAGVLVIIQACKK